MSRDLPTDHVEARRDQWRAELPDVDTQGMSILGRARWISLKVRPPIEAVFAEHDLDTGEFDVLSTLLRSGAPYQLRPTELYTALMISSGGLTARLGKLEKAKLVERLPAEDDGRVLLVRLTPEGRSRAEAAFRQDMAVEAALLAGLNDEEQAQLARLLWKLSLEIAKPGPDA